MEESTVQPTKPAVKPYITTAIPYVNGTPHIGNALDYLLADIWARYQTQNGQQVRYQVGTDEHGNKVAIKAAEQGLDPQTYTDQEYGNFESLMKKVGASYTDFIRTTSPAHKAAVQHIWQTLQPYIYKSSYTGWYCTGCEQFYTDKEVGENNGICPNHQTPFEKVEEENYFFKVSAFSDKIREAIESDRLQIVPEYRKKEFLSFTKDGLRDVSVSRPKKSLSWGVPVPSDPDQIMYVWMDALCNYITVLGYPNDPTWQEYWPASVQVVGKDIMRFHAGIWPAILLGLGLPLPKKLLVHGFVNVGGAKMSKSVGNVVDPNQIIDEYGLDAFRYYFSRHIPTMNDGDFTWEKFEAAYNGELANDLGNVVQRVASMVTRYQSGVIGEAVQAEHDMIRYHEAMDELRFSDAMDEVWTKVRGVNLYLEQVKPWEVAKQVGKDPEAEEHLGEILGHAASSLMQIGDLLVPFMPSTAAAIHETFKDGVVTPLGASLFPKIYQHTPDPKTKSQK